MKTFVLNSSNTSIALPGFLEVEQIAFIVAVAPAVSRIRGTVRFLSRNSKAVGVLRLNVVARLFHMIAHSILARPECGLSLIIG